MSIEQRHRDEAEKLAKWVLRIDDPLRKGHEEHIAAALAAAEQRGREELPTSPSDLAVAINRMLAKMDDEDKAAFKWYSPDEVERKKLNPETAEHVKRGGLILRPIRHETREAFGFGVRAG